MTNEEKAKAYDEALKRAKELLLGNEHSNTIRSYFEHIFPELRESEDERNDRMRGRVIESLVCYRGKVYDEGDKEVALLVDEEIAWMKKQKEQKPAWSEEDEKMLTGIIERGSVQVPPYTTALREEQIEWLMNRLKSLRPQPHWKPSKEDIKMLEHIIGQYETGNKNSNVMGYLPRVEELNFLKKVLSKWKN